MLPHYEEMVIGENSFILKQFNQLEDEVYEKLKKNIEVEKIVLSGSWLTTNSQLRRVLSAVRRGDISFIFIEDFDWRGMVPGEFIRIKETLLTAKQQVFIKGKPFLEEECIQP